MRKIKEKKKFDRISFIKKLAERTSGEFEKLMEEKPPAIASLSPEMRELVEKRLKKPSSEMDIHWGILFGKKLEERAPHIGITKIYEEPKKEIEAAFIAGRIKLKTDPLYALNHYFWPLASTYLQFPNHPAVPAEIGEKSKNIVRVLSRAWVLSHASDYSGFNRKWFEPFQEGYLSRTKWSALAVGYLSRIGTAEDIPAIDQISENCGEGAMEAYCSNARNKVAMRSLLEFALPNARNELKEAGLDAKMSDWHLADRLTPVMEMLGIPYLLMATPVLGKFSKLSTNPYISEEEAKSIYASLEEGLEKPFKTGGSPVDDVRWGHHLSGFSFAREEGLIQVDFMEGETPYFKLTDKGKKVIDILLSKIKGAKLQLEA